MRSLKIAVLGGGNGAHAMAADLTIAGFEVNLFEVPEFRENIEAVIKRGEIEITGVARNGIAKIKKATTNMREAVEGVDVINIVTPAFAHERFYNELAPHLEDGQIVVTHTGNYGTLQMAHILKTKGIDRDVIIGETSILVYACRKIGPGRVMVNGLKSAVPFSTLPAKNTPKALRVMNELFPQFIPATNIIETSIENLNGTLHTGICLLNAGRIEATKGDFLFYIEGATPSVSRVLESFDNERMAVARALGLKPMPVRDWLIKMYGSKGKDLYEAIQNTKAYHDRTCEMAPQSLTHRYVSEDIPYGVVPVASLGESLRIPTPTARALIHIASVVNQADYWREGITVEKMGLAGLSAGEIRDFVG
jgi:opine dehydrogenase